MGESDGVRGVAGRRDEGGALRSEAPGLRARHRPAGHIRGGDGVAQVRLLYRRTRRDETIAARGEPRRLDRPVHREARRVGAPFARGRRGPERQRRVLGLRALRNHARDPGRPHRVEVRVHVVDGVGGHALRGRTGRLRAAVDSAARDDGRVESRRLVVRQTPRGNQTSRCRQDACSLCAA